MGIPRATDGRRRNPAADSPGRYLTGGNAGMANPVAHDAPPAHESGDRLGARPPLDSCALATSVEAGYSNRLLTFSYSSGALRWNSSLLSKLYFVRRPAL